MNSNAGGSGEAVRFPFGRNWTAFLASITDERLLVAQQSLQALLGSTNLAGRRFVDVGSGSGIFSLAARRLGAQVWSFDFDIDSVRCTEYLRDRYFPGDPNWQVSQGSILDKTFVRSIGTADIVYAWGV